MKEKIQTITDSFVDYAGVEHRFLIAAVSVRDESFDVESCNPPYEGEGTPKSVRIGISVCNPVDEWDEDRAYEIAVGRARTNIHYALFATRPGMINTAVVTALLEQEAKFIKENPAQVIKGYNEARNKYLHSKELHDLYNSLTDEEKNAIKITLKSEKIDKLAKLASDSEWTKLVNA